MSRRSFLFNMIPRGKIGLEIGVWHGHFAKEIIKHTKPSELHLVDPWMFEKGMKKYFKGQKSLEIMYTTVLKRFFNMKFVAIHRCRSDVLAPNFNDGYFDWIYIDGNHTFEGVYSDLTNYYSKVKIGGLIIGDDYGGKSKGVKKAVDKFCKERDIDFKVRAKQYWFEVK
jgi:hypothetical protein